MNIQVKIKKIDPNSDLPIPFYATEHSAGMDLYAAIDESIVINPSEITLVPTGISIALPDGYEAQIRPRSGLALKNGITVLNSPGTIDADYRGEVKAVLINHSNQAFTVERGMRIAQMIIAKYEKISWDLVENLDDTQRGMEGFGSTGHK